MITIETIIKAPIEKVWTFWNETNHITNWYFASDDWHSPIAENDLQVGGKFLYRMEAKDGSFGFNFNGVYDTIIINELIEYKIEGGRNVKIVFTSNTDTTIVTESFEPENENSLELQKGGWQAILNNFKKYVEQEAA